MNEHWTRNANAADKIRDEAERIVEKLPRRASTDNMYPAVGLGPVLGAVRGPIRELVFEALRAERRAIVAMVEKIQEKANSGENGKWNAAFAQDAFDADFGDLLKSLSED